MLAFAVAVTFLGFFLLADRSLARMPHPEEEVLRTLAAALRLEPERVESGVAVLGAKIDEFQVEAVVSFSVPLLFEGAPVTRASICIDTRGRIPRGLGVNIRDPDERMAHAASRALITPVVTGDPEFDDAVPTSMAGPQGMAVALLDARTRRRCLDAARTLDAAVLGGRVVGHATVRGAPADIAAALRTALDELLAIARALSAGRSDTQVSGLLARNATEDPLVPVRLQNLRHLVSLAPDADHTREVLESLLQSEHPELLFCAARHLETAPALERIAELARSPTAPALTRAQAAFELAVAEPTAHVALFTELLESDDEALQLAAVGGLGQLELRFLPLPRMLARIHSAAPEASAALRAMFARAEEDEGEHIDQDLREEIRAVIHGRKRKERQGRLSFANARPAEGALALVGGERKPEEEGGTREDGGGAPVR